MKKLDMTDIKKEWNDILQSIGKKRLKLDERYNLGNQGIWKYKAQKSKGLVSC